MQDRHPTPIRESAEHVRPQAGRLQPSPVKRRAVPTAPNLPVQPVLAEQCPALGWQGLKSLVPGSLTHGAWSVARAGSGRQLTVGYPSGSYGAAKAVRGLQSTFPFVCGYATAEPPAPSRVATTHGRRGV